MPGPTCSPKRGCDGSLTTQTSAASTSMSSPAMSASTLALAMASLSSRTGIGSKRKQSWRQRSGTGKPLASGSNRTVAASISA
eukprot:4046435-Pyramimonas_sp.AAC.1